jgi:repressor LexA
MSSKHFQPLPLTEKEKSVLEFIEQQLQETGVSPSYQEIKDYFGFASYNSVQNYLKQLMNKGYIQVNPHQKRAIQVLKASSTVQDWMQNKNSKGSPRASLLHTPGGAGEILSIPLLGKVAAGQPIENFKHNEYVEVPPSLVRNVAKTFALQVKGSSMIEDGILDGDIILVQKQSTASNGDIVVASVDNESTVKRFYAPKQSASGSDAGNKKHLVELRPSNSELKSMWYSPDQVSIQGLVTGLFRKF